MDLTEKLLDTSLVCMLLVKKVTNHNDGMHLYHMTNNPFLEQKAEVTKMVYIQ